MSIQLQLVQVARSTASGTGLQVWPALRHAAAQTPPAYGTSSQVCSATAGLAPPGSYGGSGEERGSAAGQSRCVPAPRRSKTTVGARRGAGNYTPLDPPTQLPATTWTPSP